MTVVFARSREAFYAHLEERERRRARRLPGWRTRKHRRALAVMLVVSGSAMVAIAALWRRDLVFTGLWCLGYLVWLVAFVLLRILTGKMSSSFSALLDEREREWRHRVTYVGYQVLVVLMIAAVCYLIAITGRPDAASRGGFMLAALLLLGTSVPTVLLGWTLPDDVTED
ncbi:hypothetical protein [Amycolatopsis sacchari]|uniref:Uncharacterized protein n=1 Tax=Amycolatopsis sacchari TaxID=115433 RepID=A0A1I4DNF6_9PSEU|nr:hypothetical protein [Amycolatopsis sacchari]SFK94815.1 hypothetical protein SAMN05421835_15111 [Amycolatopsis sacchari]